MIGSSSKRDAHALDGAPGGDGRPPRGTRGVADERAERGAGDEDPARDHQKDAEDGGAGAPEQPAKEEVERLARRPAARFSEDRHDPEAEHDEPSAERPHVHELCAGDHEAADDHEHERDAEPAVPDQTRQARVDLVPHHAAVPAEPERDGEEDAQEEQREPDQLGMVLRPPALAPRALALAHARRGLRA